MDEKELEALLDALRVDLAGLSLEHGLMNGAGTVKLIDGEEGLRAFARSAAAAIMVGSITYAARTGYSDYRDKDYFRGEYYSLNARGLPNPGIEYYREYLPEMVAIAHNEDNKNPGLEPKPLFVSVVGFDIFEWAALSQLGFDAGVDLVELNFSCPHVRQDSEWFESPVCYNLELVHQILSCVQKAVGKDARVAVKLSYFPDRVALQKAVELIISFEMVKVITAINTLPLAYGYDEQGNPRLGSTGFGSLGGEAIKPLGVGQVKLLRKMCPDIIDIIGAGGVVTIPGFKEYQRAGAKVVQICTTALDKGPRIFSDLLYELVGV